MRSSSITRTPAPKKQARKGREQSADIAQQMLPHAERAAALLRALANEQRLMILCKLSGGEMSVGQLNECVPLGQSALSQHLSVLRKTGVVNTRRVSQTIYYTLKPGPAARIIETLHGIYCSK